MSYEYYEQDEEEEEDEEEDTFDDTSMFRVWNFNIWIYRFSEVLMFRIGLFQKMKEFCIKTGIIREIATQFKIFFFAISVKWTKVCGSGEEFWGIA